MEFEKVFDKFDVKMVERDKFLSRFFGIFNEEIVRIWCKSSIEYEDLGRPTIRPINAIGRGKTLDFTLKNVKTGEIYVTEMKCELQYMNYKYLKLQLPEQIYRHENKDAFKWFLKLGKEPDTFEIKVQNNDKGSRETIKVHGAALIWGVVDLKMKEEICNRTGLKEIFSLENMINDLIKEKNKDYFDFLDLRNKWTSNFVESLKKLN